MEKLRIIVGGFIGLYPTGGVTWDYIQYPLGLKILGHDVYYIEDTIQFPKFQKDGRNWDDAADSIAYLKSTMEKFGMGDRWAYRDIASGNCFGLPINKVKELCKTADVFINVSASTFLREEYLKIPKRILIDSDPMFTQIEYYHEKFVKENSDQYKMKFIVENHTHHFSFGENIQSKECKVPTFGFNWIATRQPVCIEYWKENSLISKPSSFTSVMNWSVRPNLVFDNQEWGQKNIEFEKFVNIPNKFPEATFEIMITGTTKEKEEEIRKGGWKVSDPLKAISSSEAYQNFIASSGAEFSVAKETYVKSNSGWFSCRSACYLAAGKPVITQDTQWSKFIPSGRGLFAFSDMQSATEAIAEVISNIEKHSKAAREIAEEYFDSNKVLTAMITRL